MKTIERTEKIDAYLAGTMSDKEKNEFEGLLSGSETSLEDRKKLQDEMELQKEIIFAIRRRGFRETVKKDIAEIKKEKEEHHRRRKRTMKWSLGGSGSVMTIAATFLMLFTINSMAHQMQDYSNLYIAQSMQSDNYRGETEFVPALDDALHHMQSDLWEEAEEIIDKQLLELSNSDINEDVLYQAEWLKTICLMHKGKVFKAKRLLKKIANSDSPYSENAKLILEDL